MKWQARLGFKKPASPPNLCAPFPIVLPATLKGTVVGQARWVVTDCANGFLFQSHLLDLDHSACSSTLSWQFGCGTSMAQMQRSHSGPLRHELECACKALSASTVTTTSIFQKPSPECPGLICSNLSALATQNSLFTFRLTVESELHSL